MRKLFKGGHNMRKYGNQGILLSDSFRIHVESVPIPQIPEREVFW